MRLLFYFIIIINLLFSIICYKRAITFREVITKAKLCKICYSKNSVFNISKNKMMNIYDNYFYINDTKTKAFCYIFHNDKIIDICFKGTSNYNDVCINIDMCLESYINKEIKIHKGFLNKYLSIKSIIFDYVAKIIKNNQIEEICLNGHSSGGAIASIATLDMTYLYKDKIIKCITFGAPKIGNKKFVEEYNSQVKFSLRIINKNDIIPYLPPIPLIYNHNHKAFALNDYNHYTTTYDYNHYEDNNNRTNFYNLRQLLRNVYNYFKTNHGVSKYIKNLSIYNLNEFIHK